MALLQIIDRIVHIEFVYMISWNCCIGHLSFIVADVMVSSCYSYDISSIPKVSEVIKM